jgi:ribosome silencing factor RsfS/YbeB/iojap
MPRKKAVAGPGKAVNREPAEISKLENISRSSPRAWPDDKGEDIVVLDLTGRASFADRMVIATGIADRQISAMAAHLERKLGEVGLKRVLIEGANGSDWVLIDAGDIVVHLFKTEARAHGLERMWGLTSTCRPAERRKPSRTRSDDAADRCRTHEGPCDRDLFQRYAERLTPKLEMVEVAEGRGAAAEIKRREGQALLSALPDRAFVIAMDEGGRAHASLDFARHVERWLGLSRPVCFLIGGRKGWTGRCWRGPTIRFRLGL